MLSALLLTGLFVAPVATVALFVPTAVSGRAFGAWPWARRLVLALLATFVFAAGAAGLLALLGATLRNLAMGASGLVVVSLLWLPVTRRWSARAHLCWAATTYLFVAYLAFMLQWTFVSHLGPAGTAGGMILWLLELFAGFLGCAYLWELCDALGREGWRRRVPQGVPTRELPAVGELPFVSLHVPAYNEPPDMVIATLTSLTELDYPNYEIVVIDDNTSDESLWRPVEAWCLARGVKFAHLEDWPGYKSGALNYALRSMMDPRTELIGVIDSDYQLHPEFLLRCAPLFADPGVGFIQAPQDYRDWQQAPFYRRLYYSYRYFFAVSQPSRNERDGAIFAGTMGLIRRAAVDQAGGWDEWCITEDAELSLRLLRDGWSGLHVDRSFGVGVMPLTFEALKGQRFRWCFGGIQILRQHWRLMMPGRRNRQNRLNGAQRWAYLSGALQWYGDLVGLLFFLFLLVGAGNVGLGGGLLFRKLSGFLLGAIPMLVLLGFVRAVALLRRGTGASWRDAFGAFMIWQSTGLVVARASVQGLFAREAEFLRTPKTAGEAKWWDAIRGNIGETVLALFGLAAIGVALHNPSNYGAILTAALLLWPTIAYAGAPLNSLSAQRAALPPELRARRRTEHQRYRTARRVSYAAGGLVAAGAAAAITLSLLSPGAPVQPPPLVGPAQAPSHRTSAPLALRRLPRPARRPRRPPPRRRPRLRRRPRRARVPRSMARRVPARIAIAVCLIATACAGSSGKPAGSAPADRFLARYVTGDGRVIRHDQGGDIVSEGQAYGMLIAEIAGRPSIATTIWSWTAAHLQRRDGLLEFHATGSGQVEDADSAADADVLAGYALLRYRGPDQNALHDAGRRLAAAVLAHESVSSGNDPVIVAGTWAVNTSPPTVDPSYLMPGVFSALARLTGDARWQRAATTAVTLVRGLTGDGRRLPTDWAHLETGRLVPSAAPNGSAPMQYGLDAARLPLWFGTACTADARQLAARWWTDGLSRDDRSSYLALSPEGTPLNRTDHPVPLLAGAAAATAAGNKSAAVTLRHRAAQLAQREPTYYGDAWLALSGALFDGTLVHCN